MTSEMKAIDLLGSSPPSRPKLMHPLSVSNPDIPDEASIVEDFTSYSSSSEKEGQQGRRERRKKVVTFAEYSNEPKGIMDSQDSEDEDHGEPPSPCT